MEIGKKIRELRKQRRMKLIELADQTGIQIATLSRMEHDKMTGTLASHIKLASALGVKLTDLYEDIMKGPAPSPMTAADKALTAESFSFNEKATCEMLTGNPASKKMAPAVIRIEPNGKTHPEQAGHGSERFIFLVKGKITARIEGDSFPLKTNDSLYFDASVKHWFENTGETPAKFISVTAPVPRP